MVCINSRQPARRRGSEGEMKMVARNERLAGAGNGDYESLALSGVSR